MIQRSRINKLMEQAGVLERLKNGDITQREAGKILRLTTRTIRRKLKKYKANGANSLHHGNAGRPSPRRLCREHEEIALSLIQGALHGAGPTYLAEKMEELHGIKVSDEVLRKLLIRNGLWQVSRSKPKHRKRRQRRASFGMLVQFDGSPHDWFEGRGPRCTLLVLIDDSTSALLGLHFTPSESCEGAMVATQNYFKKHGRPLELYVDCGSVWRVNLNNPERKKITQYERAMKELDVEITHARSPQAKGRVERVNKTLQDRLVKDMRLKNICSIEEANAFVQNGYLERHNAKFAVEAQESTDMHRSIEGFDLYSILSYQETRKLQQDYTISYYKQIFQITEQQRAIVRAKDEVTVSLHLDNKLTISLRDIKLNFIALEHRPERPVAPPKPRRETFYKPPKNHPFRTGIPTRYQLNRAPDNSVQSQVKDSSAGR